MEFDQSKPEAKFFTFATVAAYGATLYGACLRVFEFSTQPDASSSYNPKILMVLSEWNYFSVFEVFLGYFYLASRKKYNNPATPKIPIEVDTALLHFMFDTEKPYL
ncbi:hypothetical protein BVRB_021450 [Beta vulgaris subsp. vulgaris]|uniref:Uncharacterized protein n=1 Tax=Beta vulgaris subsp. vulgaris TaxID=3555 RepID=A0A0J8DUD9_BETVV|nr:hypothetical protein BVRB_021450 [Beta vulgaris subsp. vulgaris]